ncbi:MAG: branched-chain amino acid transport system substrate-binding protein, partial [Acidimicrobiaceae bacterium]
MTTTPTNRSASLRWAVIIVALATLATGCGSKLSDAQVLSANGVRAAGTSNGSGTAAAGGATTGSPVGGDSTGSTGVTSPPGGGASNTGGGTGDAGTPNASGADPSIGTPGETGPIILGSVGTYSGPAGASTAGLPQAVQVWAASLNQRGGLFGRQVQVIVQDDGGDPARFASSVQDLVENRHVIAFVGESTLGVQAGKGYLESKGIPVIGTDCSTVVWYQSADFFPQCAAINPVTAGLGLKAAVALTGKHQLGLVY